MIAPTLERADLEMPVDVVSTNEPRTMDYELGGVPLTFQTAGGVFIPNLTTKTLASCVTVEEGSEVLDLGCGIGPLGILAAKKGAASVLCVDAVAEACRLAMRNARLNRVSHTVGVLNGDLFGPINSQAFDVIIDDVSALAEDVARISPWYPASVPSGGPDGTIPTLRMLEEVGDFLRPGGRLYFPVISLSRSEAILSKASEVFGSHLEVLADTMIPFCPEFYEHLALLEDLQRLHLIDFTSKRSRRLWNLKILVGTKT